MVAEKIQIVPKKHQLSPQEALADPLTACAGYWDIREGHHPRHASPLAAFLGNLPSSLSMVPEHLPLAFVSHGHHVAIVHGPRAAAGAQAPLPQEDSLALAPLYVRDLAGRPVLTSPVPLPHNLSPHLLPEGSAALPDNHPLVTSPDEQFFALFRLLEWSPYTGIPLTGAPIRQVRALYRTPHHYPYKIRVESFYQDGFRLPQTTRLAVQPAPAADAALAAQEFEARWNTRPQSQSYEDFYEANNGADWFPALFTRGCTVIPTFEAFNGMFKVTADYGLADVWPGRAVEGLHTVAGTLPDESPAGTILEVRKPGFITQTQLSPAQVVVSDGSGYRSEFDHNPPFLPNLALPHPRTAPVWGATWLPTHPSHFEAPALWDWSASGHFFQTSGPLWDPLHYTYASTPKILKAFRNPNPDTPARAPVPEEMRPRFHPLTEPTWFDTVADVTFQQRQTSPVETPWQHSRLDGVPMGVSIASLGYHPLPAAYEYEADLFAFPETAPSNASAGPVPSAYAHRLIPLITPQVSAAQARKMLSLLGENPRQEVLDDVWWQTGEHLFPDMLRHQQNGRGEPAPDILVPCYISHLETSPLMVNVKRLFNKSLEKELEMLSAGLSAATYAWVEESLSFRRRMHRLVRKYPGWFRLHWWQAKLPENDTAWQQNPDFGEPDAGESLRSQNGAVLGVDKTAPSKGARRLPASQTSVKVTHEQERIK